MTQTTINRRHALAVVAAVPAAAVCGGSTAFASVGEDAELLRLWEEWKAQHGRCEQARKVASALEEKVWKATGPCWTFAKLDVADRNTYRAIFISSWHGDDSLKIVPIKTKDYKRASELAEKARADLMDERERANRAAKRRCGATRAERAYDKTLDDLREIEEAIAEAPAEGLKGIAVKLALWRHYSDDHSDTVEDNAVASVYETVVKLTGIDLAAQVERW